MVEKVIDWGSGKECKPQFSDYEYLKAEEKAEEFKQTKGGEIEAVLDPISEDSMVVFYTCGSTSEVRTRKSKLSYEQFGIVALDMDGSGDGTFVMYDQITQVYWIAAK